jgi:hypothetical protein
MNPLYEYVGNIHMHTVHSDGAGHFDELVEAARDAGLDYIFVTDHNVLVREEEEGYRQGVLTLVGQEVHDVKSAQPGNHLLCLGVHEDVTALASHPQRLIDAVNGQGALTFLAHPIEAYTDLIPRHYSWHDWEVTDYRGIELWNYMSTFRPHATSKLKAILISYFPHWFTEGPLPQMLEKWDELLAERPVVAIGGTDVHAQYYQIGIVRRCFLPYVHCAQAVNTHILSERPLCGPPDQDEASLDFQHEQVRHDRQVILDALAAGHCWIGYDLAGPTQGFRFQAHNQHGETILGGTLPAAGAGKTIFHIRAPQKATIRLMRNGEVVREADADELWYESAEPGTYRVEVWKRRWGKLRGWIFSNPIYVVRGA